MAIERQESFGEIGGGREISPLPVKFARKGGRFAFPVRTLPLSMWPENARWSHYISLTAGPAAQITNRVGDLGYNSSGGDR